MKKTLASLAGLFLVGALALTLVMGSKDLSGTKSEPDSFAVTYIGLTINQIIEVHGEAKSSGPCSVKLPESTNAIEGRGLIYAHIEGSTLDSVSICTVKDIAVAEEILLKVDTHEAGILLKTQKIDYILIRSIVKPGLGTRPNSQDYIKRRKIDV